MTTVLFFPDKLTKKIFFRNKEIIFFDNFGVEKYNNKKKQRDFFVPTINEKNYDIFKYFNEVELITIIRSWGPVLSREIDRGDQFELQIRDILIKFYEISTFLIREKVNLSILFTANPHHLSSLVFDLACRKCDVKLIYLENLNSIINKAEKLLIPFFHKKKFMNKEVLNLKFSNFKINKEIETIKKNLKDWREKKYNRIPHVDELFYSENYFLSSIRIFLFYSYSFLRRNISIHKKKIYFDFKQYSIFTYLKQTLGQYRAIKFYKKNYININSINKKNKYILIVASYQPEGTSYPEGRNYNNHIEIISKIRKKGYKGVIYYKEHKDSQFYYLKMVQGTKVGIARSVDYYKDLQKLGCKFLPYNYSVQNKKFLQCFLPVTISGTISLERSLQGLKTIYCGYPWYKGLSGTIHLDDVSLKLDKLNKSFFINNKQQAINATFFLKKLLNNKTIINYPGKGLENTKSNLKDEESYKLSIMKIIKYFNRK